MDSKKEINSNPLDNRLQNILISLSQCKSDYQKEKEDARKVREINSKLEVELKESRELEKSHRYHLSTSREMIGNLQETVSQLVYLKRDIKKLKEEMGSKDGVIQSLEQEKESLINKHNELLMDIKNSHLKKAEELTSMNEKRIQQMKHDADTQIAQFTCVIEELRAKIKEMEIEHRDKMNVLVLEYEEKLQRSTAQITQLHDQHAGLIARTDANIDAYRRRLEELEEKLKQGQFKQYLAQSTLPSSQYESQVERPYSVSEDPYDTCSMNIDPPPEVSKPKPFQATPKHARPTNTLQVTYYGNKSANSQKNDTKGPFNIVKKRKLYNEKDFKDF